MIFKKIFLTLVLCLINQVQIAQETLTLLQQGKDLFLQERYQQAFDVYQKITDKDFIVLYNMAICCLRLHQQSQVVLLCKRAEKKAQTYKEFTLLEELLNFDEDDEIVDKSWYEQIVGFGRKIILIIPIIYFQILVLMSLLWLIFGWYQRWYQYYKIVSILFLIVWFVFYGILLYKMHFMQQQCGVVIKKTVSVLSGPDISFYKKSDIQESALVTIIDQKDQFYKIRTDHLVGWVDKGNIELV